MKLTENFWLQEFEKSQTATRLGIDNSVPNILIPQIKALAINVLQPVRNQFGPTTVTSGYRSPELNRAIGGSHKSQHVKGLAADFEVPGESNFIVAKWIQDNLVFDQLILEGHKKFVPNSGWVHCSYNSVGVNRQQALTAYFSGGRVKYVTGLEE